MSEPIKIDIDAVIRQRLPKYYRFIPGFAIRRLARLIRQDELNDMLRAIGDRKGVDAAEVVLRELNITLHVDGLDRLPEGRFIFASNHPLGGLDGLALITCIGRHYGGGVRFLVNDLLMAVKPLETVFLPVNKFGRQKPEYARMVDDAFASDLQMLTFPAGLCSRRLDDGTIGDLEWKKTVVTRAVRHERDIVPVYFGGINSKRFYNIARWRKRLGIKFNFEQVLLPGEVFKQRDAEFTIRVGSPIDHNSLDIGNAAAEAARLRQTVYNLAPADE